MEAGFNNRRLLQQVGEDIDTKQLPRKGHGILFLCLLKAIMRPCKGCCCCVFFFSDFGKELNTINHYILPNANDCTILSICDMNQHCHWLNHITISLYTYIIINAFSLKNCLNNQQSLILQFLLIRTIILSFWITVY